MMIILVTTKVRKMSEKKCAWRNREGITADEYVTAVMAEAWLAGVEGVLWGKDMEQAWLECVPPEDIAEGLPRCAGCGKLLIGVGGHVYENGIVVCIDCDH